MQAQMQKRAGRNFVQTFDLDKMGQKVPLNLPSASKSFSQRSHKDKMMLEKQMPDVPNAIKDRVASVLASSEFSKKVSCLYFNGGI